MEVSQLSLDSGAPCYSTACGLDSGSCVCGWLVVFFFSLAGSTSTASPRGGGPPGRRPPQPKIREPPSDYTACVSRWGRPDPRTLSPGRSPPTSPREERRLWSIGSGAAASGVRGRGPDGRGVHRAPIFPGICCSWLRLGAPGHATSLEPPRSRPSNPVSIRSWVWGPASGGPPLWQHGLPAIPTQSPPTRGI
jgi:hypothetical protein